MSFEGFPRMTPHMGSFFLRRFKKIRLILHKKKATSAMFEKKGIFKRIISIHVTFQPKMSHSSATARQVARKFSLQLPALPVTWQLSSALAKSAKGGHKVTSSKEGEINSIYRGEKFPVAN